MEYVLVKLLVERKMNVFPSSPAREVSHVVSIARFGLK